MTRDHVTPPQVRHELSEEGSWRRTGAVVREEVAGTSTRHPVLFPYTDTYIQISLQAHNEFGYSQESVLVIRAVKGDLGAAPHSVGSLSPAAQATSRLWTETPRRTSRPRSCPWCRCWAGWWPCWWWPRCWWTSPATRSTRQVPPPAASSSLQRILICIHDSGVTNFLCEKTKTFKKFDAQSER